MLLFPPLPLVHLMDASPSPWYFVCPLTRQRRSLIPHKSQRVLVLLSLVWKFIVDEQIVATGWTEIESPESESQSQVCRLEMILFAYYDSSNRNVPMNQFNFPLN